MKTSANELSQHDNTVTQKSSVQQACPGVPGSLIADADNLTQLHHAAKAGAVSSAEALLNGAVARGQEGLWELVRVQAPLHHGATPLHWAAAYSHDVLNLLLHRLGFPTSPAAATTPIPAASTAPSLQSLDIRDCRGQTLLHYAAESDNTQSLDTLLRSFRRCVGVDPRDSCGRTPLTCAVIADRRAAAAQLLTHGAGLVPTPPSMWTPFHHAAMHDHAAMLELLYARALEAVKGARHRAAAELSATDAAGRTPLHVAAEYGSAAAAGKLMELGANVGLGDEAGETPLHLAAHRGWTEVVELLAGHLASKSIPSKTSSGERRPSGGSGKAAHNAQTPQALFDNAGWAPVHLAAAANRPEVLQALARLGFDINVPAANRPASPQGACEMWTPLHCAVASGAEAAVKTLLQLPHVNLHALSTTGHTPYDLLAVLARDAASSTNNTPPSSSSNSSSGTWGSDMGHTRALSEGSVLAIAAAFKQRMHPEAPAAAVSGGSTQTNPSPHQAPSPTATPNGGPLPTLPGTPPAASLTLRSPFAQLAAAVTSPPGASPSTTPQHTPALRPKAEGAPCMTPAGPCRSLTVSPLNSPWGASTLNRAILSGASTLAESLLVTLPQRIASVRLVDAEGSPGGSQLQQQTRQQGQGKSTPAGAVGQDGQQKAVVEYLEQELKDLELSGADYGSSKLLVRRLRGLSLTANNSTATSITTNGDRTGVSTRPQRPTPSSHPHQTIQGASLPPAVSDLLLPVTNNMKTASSSPTEAAATAAAAAAAAAATGRCLDFQPTDANRSLAAWLAVPQAIDTIRDLACMEITARPCGPGSTPPGDFHLWLGIGPVPNIASSGANRSAPGGAAAGEGGGCVLQGFTLPNASPKGATVVDLLQGQVAAGGGGGGRPVAGLRLPPQGGSAGLLWDRSGGTLVLVVAGRGPEVVASQLQLRSAPGRDPAAGGGGGGGGSDGAQLMVPLLGVQLSPGWRLQLRWGAAGGLSPECGCLDEALIAAEEQRGGQSEVPWPSKESSMTSLHFAAWVGNTRLLPQLVRVKGFSPDEPDDDGWTALHFAALAGQVAAVKELVSLGAHGNVVTKHGLTPAMMAAGSRLTRGGGTAVMECLKAVCSTLSGSGVKLRDARGRTLLMLAAEAGHLQAVEWLLQQGCDAKEADLNGRTAVQYGSEHNAIFRLLTHAVGGSQELMAAAAGIDNKNGNKPKGGGSGKDVRPRDPGDANDISAAGGVGDYQGGRSVGAILPLQSWKWAVELSDLVVGPRLGGGAFGDVHEGTYRGCEVAIKMLKDDLTPRQEAALEKELCILTSLHPHDHIVSFIGSALKDGRRALVMNRYCTNLHKAFSLLHDKQRRPERLRFRIARQIAEGLRFLHGQRNAIIHKDLKPDNVLLTKTFEVKLCDFGLSKVLVGDGPIESIGGYGHPYWMAPELLRGMPFDEKVDVWSWGVILYQLAMWVDNSLYDGLHANAVLYRWTDPKALPPRLTDNLSPKLAPEVANLLRDCLAEDPKKRPSMQEVLERLACFPCNELPDPSGR